MNKSHMRRRIVMKIRGVVQGVGFRPFILNLATKHRLSGFVVNRMSDVLVEAEGNSGSLDEFINELQSQAPPLAQLDEIQWENCALQLETSFRVLDSEVNGLGNTFLSPDIATCGDCLAELFDPADRRYRYAFLNCTHCGPRFTIIKASPFDRERTTMSSFALCEYCEREYRSPKDRRFHAQAIACPVCGPRLELWNSQGENIESDNPVSSAADAIREGKIGALKGLGGFHLLCDARNESAVKELRLRKGRDEKPFAIMVRDVAAAEGLCIISDAERELLISPERPIVLLQKRRDGGVAESVALRNPNLGVMLPYTPLHHLLLREVSPLVMTSGNLSDEPIVCDEMEAVKKLRAVSDFFLVHNRPINVRCDDSIVRVIAKQPLFLRRSRGYAPAPVSLPINCPSRILALGGQLKNTFALGQERHAILSQHMGDLDHYQTYCAYAENIRHFEKLFSFSPEILVHDFHPDYASTRYALERSQASNLKILAVQHHHAHLASCLADNNLNEQVIGVIFDGTGFGSDGTVWGGEFLIGDWGQFERAGHLRCVPIPGGEAAIREPWRMTASHLVDAGERLDLLEQRIPSATLSTVSSIIAKRFNAPLTSSCGRLFDAVAAMVGICDQVSYEGQAAVELEWLASKASPSGSYEFGISDDGLIDTRPIISGISNDLRQKISQAIIARRFHSTMVEVIAKVCIRLRERSNLKKVVLSGGVFMNAILVRETKLKLSDAGFRVYTHRRVPPNDGGLSLGQLAVAAARMNS